jgi:hypothetical protein
MQPLTTYGRPRLVTGRRIKHENKPAAKLPKWFCGSYLRQAPHFQSKILASPSRNKTGLAHRRANSSVMGSENMI